LEGCAVRKARDYKAEDARRDARYRALGFLNRRDFRTAVEKGYQPAAQPSRLRSPKTIAAQAKRKAEHPDAPDKLYIPSWIRSGKVTPEQRAQDWSNSFAMSNYARYAPDGPGEMTRALARKKKWPLPKSAAEMKITREEYTKAYLRAFVDGPYDLNTNRVGNADLYYWFVTLNDYMEVSEYESRYGTQD